MSSPTVNTKITLGLGLQEVTAYRNLIDSFEYPDDVSKTIACHVKKEDLIGMLTEGDIDGIRCYLGLRTIDDKESSLYGMQVTCFVMVGTRLLPDGTNEDVLVTRNGESGIYEFTTPCPDSCDPNSPLNNIG